MKCPECGNQKTKVIDSRAVDDGAAIRRRRKCPSCGTRFTTFEKREISRTMVIKRNGSKEPYNREKLAIGLYKACNKRDVSETVIEESIDEVEEKIMKLVDKEVPASEIGDMVMECLREIDEIAYLRFASVYKRFRDVSEFHKELGELMAEDEESTAVSEKMERST